MTAVLETLGVALLALGGSLLGWTFSRLKSKAWAIGYVVPLAVIVTIAAARRFPQLTLVAPFSWIMAGRLEFALFGAMAAMLLTTPLSRLKSSTRRALIIGFIAFMVCHCSILPFLQPVLIRRTLSRLETRIDGNGVCLQSTGYTCGPAAAVTAVRRLGLEADEGELAILSHTTSFAGTPADLLCAALQRRYGSQGIQCEYRSFASVEDLRHAGLVLAEVKHSVLIDHWVAVLDIGGRGVAIGDPLLGRRTLAREEFERVWRFMGIVVKRRGKEEK